MFYSHKKITSVAYYLLCMKNNNVTTMMKFCHPIFIHEDDIVWDITHETFYVEIPAAFYDAVINYAEITT